MAQRLTDQQKKDRAVLEKAFQQRVIRLAKRCGWKVVHFHAASVGSDGEQVFITPVSGDAKGFPDLILVKPGRQPIFAELKRELGKVSPEQWEWLDLLIAAGQFGVVWRPSDMEKIKAVLK